MKKLSFTLLILGLLFSQLFRIVFNLNNGFEFHHITVKLLPIADYAGKASPQLFLTSTIIGYIAFVIFGIINTNKIKSPDIFKSALIFTFIAILVSFFEFTSILEDINGTFQGKHFRIGWLLFLLGLWIFSKKYFIKKKS
ncbi:MAG: hypothetical protein C0597_14530 [Marinilabiliales bacterium]|nr:MAG: hypothetical protein C0597_14530 [Marinilabiliales bacterium]